jgi:hypothetical protein
MADRQPATDEPTIGKLVVDAFDDFGTLLRHVIDLAKAELKVSVRAGGVGIALFALAGFVALFSLVMLSFAIAYFIVMAGLDPAWAFLIVFGAYLVLAGLFVLGGVLSVKRVRAPEKTIAQASEIPSAFKRP